MINYRLLQEGRQLVSPLRRDPERRPFYAKRIVTIGLNQAEKRADIKRPHPRIEIDIASPVLVGVTEVAVAL
ncbi:hypothetical protein D3C74_311730 [compost metagenome]